eukprot:2633051-Amphidinium_carterae.1
MQPRRSSGECNSGSIQACCAPTWSKSKERAHRWGVLPFGSKVCESLSCLRTLRNCSHFAAPHSGSLAHRAPTDPEMAALVSAFTTRSLGLAHTALDKVQRVQQIASPSEAEARAH